MSTALVFFEQTPHAVFRVIDDWGIQVYDLASPPRRLRGSQPAISSPIRTHIDPYQTKQHPLPGQLLNQPLDEGDTWSAMTKRSLARFASFFLVAEDPQRRLEAREVITLAHQVSLVRHILDTPGRRRVLIGDEVGLGKTVVAGLIIQELLEENPGLRVLYLAPARLVSNVGREFKRLELYFREWKSLDGDARLDTDTRIIASIHRAVHPNHYDKLLKQRPWDVIVVDECHHLSDWSEGGGDPVMKYRLVRDLVNAQPPEGRLLLLSGTPHQAHAARFDNLLRLLIAPGETKQAAAGRVIYRTKEDVRDWDGNPLFPKRQVNPPIIVDLDPGHRVWLESIHEFFQPHNTSGSEARQRAAGWKCAQALQWAASSPNAGLGYLVRQALRAGWTLKQSPLADAISALRPYRAGSVDEPIDALYSRLVAEIRRQVADDDVEDIEEDIEGLTLDVNHEELASLIRQGIKLVRSPNQFKWERLWGEVLEPAGEEKVVLFAQPIETVMALSVWLKKRTGIQPAIIIGGQSDTERDQQVARFKDPGGPRFLISSRAGGEGINLQFSRRLVHLDVPWNPMEMEQRVGRVHRFGSKQTILVDTIVVRDSRETHAWHVARERLLTIAQTLVSPDRFDAVFSRVMCLIPPEELQSVLISSPASPLGDGEIQRLSSMVDSGFRDWQSFHEKYSANQRTIRDQPAGLAQWSHLQSFLIQYGDAKPAPGVSRVRFIQSGDNVQTRDEVAEVLKLKDGSLCFVGNYEGGIFNSNAGAVGPLGLNIPSVAELLNEVTNPKLPTGAAHLRWGDKQQDLKSKFGDEVVFLCFARQSFRFDSVGGINESGIEMMSYAVYPQKTSVLSAGDRLGLFDMAESATVRVKPVESSLRARASQEEERILNELRRPSEDEIRQGIRFAVWPILALHMTA